MGVLFNPANITPLALIIPEAVIFPISVRDPVIDESPSLWPDALNVSTAGEGVVGGEPNVSDDTSFGTLWTPIFDL